MTFTKLTIAALLVACLSGVGGTLYFRADAAAAHQNAAQATQAAKQYQALAEARMTALTAIRGLWMDERAALLKRAQAAEAQAKQFKEQSDAINKALRDNPEWSDSPIPDSVRNAFKWPTDRP